MTCEHCQGPVDVPSGANLRCGCGKTTQPAPLYAGLPELLTLMRDHKALRVRTAQYEVELSPLAFAQSWPAQTTTAAPLTEVAEQCTCGHAIYDHNQTGCVHGCDVETCGRAGEAQAA